MRWYAKQTGQSLEEYRSLAQRVAWELPPGASVLEVAPGPGYFPIELAKLGNFQVTCLDIGVSEPRKALENMPRVRKPGGRGLIIDVRKDVVQNRAAPFLLSAICAAIAA